YLKWISSRRVESFMAIHGIAIHEPDGCRVVRAGDGPWLCSFIRLLVHGFSRGAARDGRQVDVCSAAYAVNRGRAKDVLSFSRDFAWNDCDSLNLQGWRA